MSFADADILHAAAARATATREVVHLPFFSRWATSIQELIRTAGDYDDELWGEFIRRCRRVRRELALTPLAPAHSCFDLAESVEFLTSLLAPARSSYPDTLIARADLCIVGLDDLRRVTTNPVGDLVLEILSTGDPAESCVTLLADLHRTEVNRWLQSELPGIRLAHAREIAGSSHLESLVAVGPSLWFPRSLLSAPRAESICFVHYDWIRDGQPETRVFSDSSTHPGPVIRSATVEGGGRSSTGIAAEDLLPTIDWNALSKVSGSSQRVTDSDDELVEARLFLLAGGQTVFLETIDGPTIYAVTIESGEDADLHSVPTNSIHPGDFLVLRSRGSSGDYVPSVADSILGHRAERLRAKQASWKELLRYRIREHGLTAVERDLRRLGVKTPNLRYRIMRNSIRTKRPEDFRLLMEYLELGPLAEELWTAMGEIQTAHIQAGQMVRRMLEGQVGSVDVPALAASGVADVQLDGMDAGALTIYRVEARAPETTLVLEDDLRNIREVEEDLWFA